MITSGYDRRRSPLRRGSVGGAEPSTRREQPESGGGQSRFNRGLGVADDVRIGVSAGRYRLTTAEPYVMRYLRLSAKGCAITVRDLRLYHIAFPATHITARFAGQDDAMSLQIATWAPELAGPFGIPAFTVAQLRGALAGRGLRAPRRRGRGGPRADPPEHRGPGPRGRHAPVPPRRHPARPGGAGRALLARLLRPALR